MSSLIECILIVGLAIGSALIIESDVYEHYIIKMQLENNRWNTF